MPDPKPSAARRGVTIPVVVAVIAVLIAGVTLASSWAADDAKAPDTRPAAEVSPGRQDGYQQLAGLARRTPGDPTARGDADAPVVLIAYSEFQCPFCGRFARTTEPTLVKKYVESGTLRIEWRDFPYLGPESRTAAHAGRAAAAQGRFWEFHDAMYADQQPPNSGRLTEDYLVGVARRLGLDTATFRRDMGSSATAAAVQHDFNEGQSIGVTGTPAFLVNGQPIMGAQPTAVFEKAIEQAAGQ